MYVSDNPALNPMASDHGRVGTIWSAMANFVDGLFWMAVLGVGHIFSSLSQLLYGFHCKFHGPIPGQGEDIPAELSFENTRESAAVDYEVKSIVFEWAQSQREVKQEIHTEKHEIVSEESCAIRRRPPAHDHGRAFEGGHLKESKDLQQALTIFLCNVHCHRSWKKWYAVVCGRQVGVYKCWDCTKLQVGRFNGQMQVPFPTQVVVEDFFLTQWHCRQNHY